MNPAGIIDKVPKAVRQQWAQNGAYPNQSVFDLFSQQVQKHPDQLAVLSFQENITYAQLLDKVRRLTTSFKSMGVVAGDVIAYCLTNSWQCCAIDLAAAALGAIVAPFPPGRGKLDVESLIRRCDARMIIIEAEYGKTNQCELIESLRPTLLSLRFLVVDSDAPPAGWHSLPHFFRAAPIYAEQLPYVCPDSPVRFLISSGTESEPKWVRNSSL